MPLSPWMEINLQVPVILRWWGHEKFVSQLRPYIVLSCYRNSEGLAKQIKKEIFDLSRVSFACQNIWDYHRIGS